MSFLRKQCLKFYICEARCLMSYVCNFLGAGPWLLADQEDRQTPAAAFLERNRADTNERERTRLRRYLTFGDIGGRALGGGGGWKSSEQRHGAHRAHAVRFHEGKERGRRDCGCCADGRWRPSTYASACTLGISECSTAHVARIDAGSVRPVWL